MKVEMRAIGGFLDECSLSCPSQHNITHNPNNIFEDDARWLILISSDTHLLFLYYMQICEHGGCLQGSV